MVNEATGVLESEMLTQPDGDDPTLKDPLAGGLTVMTVPCVREMTSGCDALPVGDKKLELDDAVADGVTDDVFELDPPPHAAMRTDVNRNRDGTTKRTDNKRFTGCKSLRAMSSPTQRSIENVPSRDEHIPINETWPHAQLLGRFSLSSLCKTTRHHADSSRLFWLRSLRFLSVRITAISQVKWSGWLAAPAWQPGELDDRQRRPPELRQ
jgi:hypothetical protein